MVSSEYFVIDPAFESVRIRWIWDKTVIPTSRLRTYVLTSHLRPDVAPASRLRTYVPTSHLRPDVIPAKAGIQKN